MKLPILLQIIAVFAFAQAEPSFAALMAGWTQFNAGATPNPFPKSADFSDTGISSALMNDPVNLTKFNTLARFELEGWNTGSSVDTSEYLEISLSIQPGYTVNFSDLQINARDTGATLNIHVRSDADSYTSDLGSFTLTSTYQVKTVDLSSLANQTGTRTFRLYGTDATAGFSDLQAFNNASIPGGGIIAINGTATVVPEPYFYASMSGLALLAFALWRRIKRA